MPTDTQRIVRALEILDSTGRSLADWQRQPGRPVLSEGETVRLLPLAERQGHGAAIDARLDAMLAAGALERRCGRCSRLVSGESPIMPAHGCPRSRPICGGRFSGRGVAVASRDMRHVCEAAAHCSGEI